MIFSEAAFERLPYDGRWEVVDGRAILLPPSDYHHQRLSDRLTRLFEEQLEVSKGGFAVSAPNVFIPRKHESLGGFQNRVPDVVVSIHKPKRHFEVGSPPELAIEILSTRRGNVERTEKLDDYALAGIVEYWIVNPFDRTIEVYVLQGAEYSLAQTTTAGTLSPGAFQQVEINLSALWNILETPAACFQISNAPLQRKQSRLD